ncbi:MAG: sulfatase-like hydrolase/transferase [Labilibaculum sp.]|nr:sulfatase-like hydrolase/transferase [Labilibaculum sp.]
MNFQNSILLASVLLSMIGVSCNTQEIKTNDKKPNVIIILADDAGYADFGFMGCSDLETPNIDRLAKDGIIFTDAHVSATVCSPSRAGLLTGRYQQRFGHECNIPPHDLGMDTTEVSIASAMKQQGYQTACFGKWHLGKQEEYHPNQRGFDEFFGFLEGSRSYFPNKKYDEPGNPHEIQHNGEHVDFTGYLTDVLGDKAIEYIDKQKDNPFFIYLSFNAVHTPMQATKEDLKRYDGHARQDLAAMTWAMDRAIGKLVNKLKKEKIYENTLIFFLSDNGGAHSNQSSCLPLKGWKGNKFEGGHRVPFVMSWPQELKGGQKYHSLTSALDIYATAYELAGGKESPGKKLDGTNLIPFVKGENKKAPHEQLFWRKGGMAATREGDWKLIRLDNYGCRLYNVSNDLGETKDLQNEEKFQMNKMKQSLENWESNLMNPLWTEDKYWNEVTFEIHKALMENRTSTVHSPADLDKKKYK